jgi:hypothetical protein
MGLIGWWIAENGIAAMESHEGLHDGDQFGRFSIPPA